MALAWSSSDAVHTLIRCDAVGCIARTLRRAITEEFHPVIVNLLATLVNMSTIEGVQARAACLPPPPATRRWRRAA